MPKLTAEITKQFVDQHGLRNVRFQLFRDDAVGLPMTRAIVDIVEGDIVNIIVSDELEPKRRAVRKLAMIHYHRA